MAIWHPGAVDTLHHGGGAAQLIFALPKTR